MKNLKKVPLSVVFDAVIISFFSFILAFSWIRFLSKSRAVGITLGVIISLLTLLFYSYFAYKKFKKNSVNFATTKEQEKFEIFIKTRSKKDLADFLQEVFDDKNPKKVESGIAINGTQFIKIVTNSLMMGEILQIIGEVREKNFEEIVLYYFEIDKKDELKILSIVSPKITLVKIQNLLKIAKEKGVQFDCPIKFRSRQNLTFKTFFNLATQRHKAKTYFLCGLLLFFCSQIAYNSIYYLLSTSLLLFLGFMCLRRKKEEAPSPF